MIIKAGWVKLLAKDMKKEFNMSGEEREISHINTILTAIQNNKIIEFKKAAVRHVREVMRDMDIERARVFNEAFV